MGGFGVPFFSIHRGSSCRDGRRSPRPTHEAARHISHTKTPILHIQNGAVQYIIIIISQIKPSRRTEDHFVTNMSLSTYQSRSLYAISLITFTGFMFTSIGWGLFVRTACRTHPPTIRSYDSASPSPQESPRCPRVPTTPPPSRPPRPLHVVFHSFLVCSRT